MKKQVLVLAALGGMLWTANHANAQDATITGVVVEETPVVVENVQCKDIYTPGSWKDNWYIQFGAGMMKPYVENFRTDGAKDHRHITAVYNIGVGRWISPYLGFRFSGYYGKAHWNTGKMVSASVANLNVDFMWDMFNSIGGYSPDRVFSLVPYIGLGASFIYDYKPRLGNDLNDGKVKHNQWMLPVSAGIQARFRCSNYVDIFAEGRAHFYGDNFNNEVGNRPVDINITAIAGLAIHFTGSKFEHYNPCDYVNYINSANNQVNDLRAALAASNAALAAAEAQLPCPEVTEVQASETVMAVMPTVRFKINSAYVSSEEMVNVYNMAEFMKANPEMSVVVRGYADKDTGTSEYNMKLSERRAQAVADILTGDYGINPARLTLEAAGSNTQIYDTNDWNRIVIFALPE